MDPHQNAGNGIISCDAQCARNIPMLMLMPLLGLIAFVCTKNDIRVPWLTTLIDVSSPYLFDVDSFLLPRSNFELPRIQEAIGGEYYDLAMFIMTACALMGWLVVIRAALGSFRQEKPLLPSKNRYVVFGILIVAGFLVFRHPYAGRLTSILDNHLDTDGFYFLRETCLISGGFYYLSLIAANLFSFRLAPL